MPNPFFNFYRNKPEQNLVEDLINESISMFGFTAHYIPNINDAARDLLYGDDPLKYFSDSYPLDVYLSNSVDPGMNMDFFSKFGLEIKNNIRILMSRRSFSKTIQGQYSRPREGDLVYVFWASGTGELYEIKYVNDAKDNFTLGRSLPYYWELELELFKYSHEQINTEIDEIDIIQKSEAYSIVYTLNSGGVGDYIEKEIVYQGTSLANANCAGYVSNWNANTFELTLNHISRDFANTQVIIGATSNAQYTLVTYDSIDIPHLENAWDNQIIKDESFGVIDNTEIDPTRMLG